MATSTSRFKAPVRASIKWDHLPDDAGARLTFTTPVTFADEVPSRAGEQEAINDLFAKYGAGVALRACRVLATRDHHQYPQYRQYWLGDDWQLAVATYHLAGKGGTQAARGDLVMARREPSRTWPNTHWGTFYSVRRGVNCGISGGIKWL